ncbi:ABC transporter ATP-binding protein [Thermotoga sp. KOL6]|uniref:ABC transporter ATP-binding protein n=1 Tax=Thermotoga sp. KOL6 TaxID=126741 RepID=UPI000C7610C6|nr:ABC transporter ATP-binding protein [Thermotoga sp. KOL6]PLV59766.1 iron ABC transporter ATP-binding protein [Thermotoga sp. KOL6]
MARIVLNKIEKFFGKNHVIKNLNLGIEDGEFVTLLGPSGCGKTTTLRMIAGFESPSSGEILINGKCVFSKVRKINVPPEERNIGMVFQNYAVWPHMSVFDNIAYPLKIRKMPKDEIKERVERIIEVVKLRGLEGRFPYQLSGGQQQRVAFARALVYSPKILLLDEPLSNLDAKLREEMRFEIKDIQRRIGVTVVYVTHDQSEAMVMSDRIVVLKDGVIQQIGSPAEIYEFPKNRFVAGFIGISNFLKGEIIEVIGNDVEVKLLELADKPIVIACHKLKNLKKEVTVVIRPEDLEITPKGNIKAKIKKRTFLGDHIDYIIFAGKEIRIKAPKYQIFEEGEYVKLKIKKAVIVED